MKHSGLVLEEDGSGSRMRLAWQGPPPNPLPRRIVAIAVPIAVALWLLAVDFAWRETLVNLKDRTEPILLWLMIGFSAWLLYIVCAAIGNSLSYLSEIAWDRTEGTMTTRRSGWYFWGRSQSVFPLADLRSMFLDLGPEGRGAVSTTLSIFPKEGVVSARTLREDITPLDLAARAQGIEFLFKLGRLLGAIGYSIHKNSPYFLSLQLWFTRPDRLEDDEHELEEEESLESSGVDPIDIQPLPAVGVIPEIPAPRPIAVGNLASNFKPESLQGKLEFTRLLEWAPGRRVHVARPAPPGCVWVIGIVFFAGLGALAGAFPIWGLIHSLIRVDPSVRYVSLAVCAFLGGLVGIFLIHNRLAPRELILDWAGAQIMLKIGARVLNLPLGAVQSVVMSEKLRVHTSEDGPSKPSEFGMRVDLLLRDRDVLVLETDRWETDSRAVRQLIAPLAGDLARALHVACIQDQERARTAETPWLTRVQGLILASIVIMAGFFLARVALMDRSLRNTADALKALGVDVGFMGKYGRQKQTICENYWYLEVKDFKPLAQYGPEIRELLLRFPRIGMHAEKSNLTDADLEIFHGVKWCLIKIAETTSFSDTGAAPLMESEELVYVDADATRFGDRCLNALASGKLEYLSLWATHVSDAGLAHLQQFPSLKVVRVSGIGLTDAGWIRFHKALPHVRSNF